MRRSSLSLTLSVAALLTSFAVVAVQFLARLWPEVDFRPLLASSLLIALESQAAWRYLHGEHLGWFEWQGLRYIFAEWGMLALLIKATMYLPGGLAALQQDATAWQAHFSAFFEPAYLGALSFGFVIWVLARQCAADLERLRIHESDRLWEELAKLEEDRHVARQRLGARLLGMGTLLVVLTGLTRLDAGQFFQSSAAASGSLRALVVYFAFALVLLGQSWLTLLQGRWWWQGIPVQEGIIRRWLFSALGVLCAAGLLALVLPARYTMGLLDVLWLLFDFVAQLASYLFFVLLLLVSLVTTPFFWLLRLLSGTSSGGETDLPKFTPPSPPPLPEPATVSSGLPWWETLRAVLFWVLFLGALVWVLTQYLRQNRAWWEQMQQWPVLRQAHTLWEWLRGFLRGAGEQVGSVAAAGREYLARLRRGGGAISKVRIHRTARTPRERVFFYYRTMLQRGAQAGIPRKPAETPRQYALRLRTILDEDLHPQVDRLTHTFETARYRPVSAASPGLAEQARRAWHALRRQLRRARQI